jgi:hypothetical protein
MAEDIPLYSPLTREDLIKFESLIKGEDTWWAKAIEHLIRDNKALATLLKDNVFLEPRNTFGAPSVVIQPPEYVMDMVDKQLGDCGPGPVELRGYVKMSDGIGAAYICLWNPKLNPKMQVPKE